MRPGEAMMESWKPFQETWEVNSEGIVRNRKTKRLLKIRLRRDGYLDVKLNYKRFLVHRLVAITFIPNNSNKPQVNHKDGNKANPCVANLEWVDQFENMQHSVRTGLFPDRAKEQNSRATITYADYIEIKQFLSDGFKPKEIAVRKSISIHVVYNIKYKKAWRYE